MRPATLFALALLGTMASSGGAAERRDLRAAESYGRNYPTVRALEHFAELIEDRTDGRLRLQVFHSRQLGEEKQTLEQTRLGAIDLNRINVAALADVSPEARALTLPYLFRSDEHLAKVLGGPIGQEVLDSLEGHGLVGLAFFRTGARSIYGVRPVRRPADLAGVRVRVQPSETMGAVMRALGAEPVPLAEGQVATGLETGLIHGAESNWPTYVSSGHHQAAPYFSATAHTMSPEVLVVSKQLWDRLSPEDRRAFREAAQETSIAMWERWLYWEESLRNAAGQLGITVVTDVDREALQAAVGPVWEEALRHPRVRDLAERIGRE
ncbi:MAG TPA: TRAP transporter substrate-binding protein [Beijerinckiaceae bacterium]|nr:TRAP transporter substrate-binding protein [Beijerinckiaceae bacterium]